MSKTTSFFDFAKIENDNENKLKVSDGMMLATGLAGDQPVIGYSTDEVKKIVENYKSGLTGLPGNWQVGVAGATPAATGQTVDIDTGSDAGALSVGGAVGGTPGAGATAAGAPITISGTDTGKLEFDAWKAQYGVDTEKGFQDSVSRLDYEMKTWAANYGANAERLARMGLSNSGVVDIYGTGVVQAYLQSMNDLYLAKAEGDRQNAEAYKKYSDEYEADLAAKTQTKNNNIFAAYNYGFGLYNGSNLNEVTTMIRNAGYDEDVITEAVARLSAVDPSMLPALQAQLAQEQADVTAMVEQLLSNGYTADMEQSATDVLKATYGWSDEKIAKVIQGANGLLGMTPKADNLTAGIQAVNKMLAKNNVAYDGSEAQKTSIRQALRRTEYEAMTDQILAQLDADLGEVKGAAALDEIAEIEAVDVDTLTIGGIETKLTDASTKYGVDSEEYKNVAAKYEGQLTEIIGNALKDPDKTAQAFEVANDTVISVADDNEITWGEASTEQKVFYVMERLADLYQSGAVSEKTYTKLMSDYIKKDVDLYSNSISDCVDWVVYIKSSEIPYNVKMSLIDVVSKNAELHSTYVYNDIDYIDNGERKTGSVISIAQKDKQGQQHFNLVVNKASESEDFQVKKVMKDGQDIYYVAGNIYVIDRTAGGEEIYKVDPNASKRLVIGKTPMSKDNRQGAIEMQNAFYELVLRYAYTHQ